MKIGAAVFFVSLVSVVTLAQSAPRVAVVDFVGDERDELRVVLEVAASRSELVDAAQMRAAIRGAGYLGSLNLSRDEATDLGRSLGCDLYFLGQMRNLKRLGIADEAYFEASAAIFLVETRNGRLVLFDLATARSTSQTEASAALMAVVRSRSERYVEAITLTAHLRLDEVIEPVPVSVEMIEILDGEIAATNISQPVFFQRMKPAYTTEAALAGVVATVDVKAVFGADGKVSEVDLVRWAGFGLDESAIATVRALRFKPAERDGRAVAVRALVRYNFVRPPSAAEREAEADRLRRSLRKIGKL